MNSRSEYALSLVGLLVGAIVAFVGVGRGWASVEIESGLGIQVLQATGRDLFPLAGGGPLVALAGVVAVLATRSMGRVVVGLMLALSGVGLAVVAALAAVALDSRMASWTQAQTGQKVPATAVAGSGWPWLVVLAAVLIAGSGAMVALRGRRWPAMGARFESPAAAPAVGDTALSGSRDVWDALDRGDDPTSVERPTDQAAESDPPQ